MEQRGLGQGTGSGGEDGSQEQVTGCFFMSAGRQPEAELLGSVGSREMLEFYYNSTEEKNGSVLLLEKDVNNLHFTDQSGSWEPLSTQWRVWCPREPTGRHTPYG